MASRGLETSRRPRFQRVRESSRDVPGRPGINGLFPFKKPSPVYVASLESLDSRRPEKDESLFHDSLREAFTSKSSLLPPVLETQGWL